MNNNRQRAGSGESRAEKGTSGVRKRVERDYCACPRSPLFQGRQSAKHGGRNGAISPFTQLHCLLSTFKLRAPRSTLHTVLHGYFMTCALVPRVSVVETDASLLARNLSGINLTRRTVGIPQRLTLSFTCLIPKPNQAVKPWKTRSHDPNRDMRPLHPPPYHHITGAAAAKVSSSALAWRKT